ncbi:MAG: hypothetical protein ACFE0J_05815 [Elainellaceae cyanobacterium]
MLGIANVNIAENIVLGIAILSVLWLTLSLRHSALDGGGLFPALIPMALLWIVAIAIVLTFHLSPFHLIWLFILGIPLSLIAIMIPPVQSLSMGFLILLSMTGASQGEQENPEQIVRSKTQRSSGKQNPTGKGFGRANSSKKKK